jgi:hypothetical protein
MINAKIKKLEAAKAKIAAKIAALEKKMSVVRAKQLVALPAKHGFESLADFIKALKGAAGGKRKGAKPATGKKRRKRAVITAATRAEVKKQVEAGKTGAAIAKSVGISLPSVQNIKKALGLVQARKK